MEKPIWKRIDFVFGVALALAIWGAQLIGVTVNLYLGAVVLAIAFVLLVRAFWVWEGSWSWHVGWRILTVVIAALIYSATVGWQIRAEWLRLRQPIAENKPTPQIPVTAPIDTPLVSLPSSVVPAMPRVQVRKSKHSKPEVETSGDHSPAIGTITQAPGSALSVNQQGGVTAGTINVGVRWSFNGEIQKAMITDLSGTTGRVRLGWPTFDPDGLSFAGGLLYTFQHAGWTQEPQKVNGTYAGSNCIPSEKWDCHGIRIQFKDPSSPLAKTVLAAFGRINAHLDVAANGDLDDDLVDVLVSKP